MAVSEIVISIANVLETALLVAIIIEFIKIFTSKKKEGESSVSESVLAASKKLFGNSEEKIAKNEADAKKDEQKINEIKQNEKEDKNKLVDIQRLINGLTIQGKDRISKLINGHKQLVAAAPQPQFVDLAPKLSEKIIIPMNNEAKELAKDVAKIKNDTLVQLQLFRDLNQNIENEKKAITHGINRRNALETSLVNSIQKIKQEIETVEHKKEAANLSKDTMNENAAKLELLTIKLKEEKEKLNTLQTRKTAKEEKIKLDLSKLEELQTKYLKPHDSRELMRLETTINREIQEILTELQNINNNLINLYKQKTTTGSSVDVDKLAREKIENYDKKLPILGEHIQNVANGYQAISIIAANTSGQIAKLNDIFGQAKDLNMGTATNELTEKPTAKKSKGIDFENLSANK